MKNPLFLDDVRWKRVFRGGSWYFFARDARVSDRSWHPAPNHHFYQSFRIFRTLTQKEK